MRRGEMMLCDAFGKFLDGEETELVEALGTLKRAREIRADAALMERIRLWLRTQRDQMGLIIDDLGESL